MSKTPFDSPDQNLFEIKQTKQSRDSRNDFDFIESLETLEKYDSYDTNGINASLKTISSLESFDPNNSGARAHVYLAIENEILRIGTASVLRKNGFAVHESCGDEIDIVEQSTILKSKIIISDKSRASLLKLSEKLTGIDNAPAIISIDLSPDEQLLLSKVTSYLISPFTADVLLLGVESALEKSLFFSTTKAFPVRHTVVEQSPAVSTSLTNDLSERELEVLLKLSAGLTNKEVGEHLFVTTETVKSHLHNLLRKLNVKNRTQLVSKFLQSNQ